MTDEPIIAYLRLKCNYKNSLEAALDISGVFDIKDENTAVALCKVAHKKGYVRYEDDRFEMNALDSEEILKKKWDEILIWGVLTDEVKKI